MNRRRPAEIEQHRGAYGPLAALVIFVVGSIVAAILMGGGL